MWEDTNEKVLNMGGNEAKRGHDNQRSTGLEGVGLELLL
jgi:hypothetical protein